MRGVVGRGVEEVTYSENMRYSVIEVVEERLVNSDV